ncbi:protein kinase domain-containing protein [Nocardiopsis sp. CA-288880]|uniref:protein kinase domain-containing protein n=1 Tax=Nocardiopsis sp. CA-288880 TaxID=3239995 RepID=UPI003D98A94C
MATPLRDGDPLRIGPYRLAGRLGTGGMGRVFLGRSPGGRLVAVKTVHPELAEDPEFRRRFAAEAAAARKVGGFYTAQVVDADPDADPPWLATAYIPGPSLHRAVADHGPLPAESVAVLGAGLAEGLAAVHACGVVHRDLKPANVVLAEDGPRLIDFGIARALDATSFTRTSTVLGTAAFMSPEQARALPVGPASDVFSLGCVLAFAATGHSPFGQGPAHAVAYRIVHEAPDLGGVPTTLAALVAGCLAKEPDDRPGVGGVLEELAALTASLPAPAHERWLPEELTRVVAARRTLALTAVVPAADASEEAAPAVGTPAGGVPEGDAPAERATRGSPPAGPVPEPVPEPGDHRGTAPRPPGPDGRTAPLLVHERRRARGEAPPRPARPEQTAVHWMLALFALAAAVAVVHQLVVAAETGVELSGHAYAAAREPWGWRTFALALWGVQIALGAGLVVSWLAWFLRVRTLAESFAPGRLRYRPRMAVLGWFVPVGNLWLPKQIADDVWHASSPADRGGRPAPAGAVHLWWALWLPALATWPLFWTPWALMIEERHGIGDFGSIEVYEFEFLPMAWAALAAHALAVPAAIAAAVFVRRLTDMQAARLGG